MSAENGSGAIEHVEIEALKNIVQRDQTWPRMAAKWGVENPVPPWKTSLDGMCDALDHANCEASIPNFKDRRDEEDAFPQPFTRACHTRRTSWFHWRTRWWLAASSTRQN
jgi:hypothetical protein